MIKNDSQAAQLQIGVANSPLASTCPIWECLVFFTQCIDSVLPEVSSRDTGSGDVTETSCPVSRLLCMALHFVWLRNNDRGTTIRSLNTLGYTDCE